MRQLIVMENEDAGNCADEFDMFREPDDFRPKTPPPQVLRVPYDFSGHGSTTMLLHAEQAGRSTSEELKIHLLGSHPLWGHHLWNASLDMSRYLQAHAATLLDGKAVLELGAAAGIPSIVCAREGAKLVVATDYPDKELIEVLRRNMDENSASSAQSGNIVVTEGYLWGSGDAQIKSHLFSTEGLPRDGFELLLLSDLIFNHQAHDALLTSMSSCLTQTARASASVDPSDLTQSFTQLFSHDEINLAFPENLELDEFTKHLPTTPCVLVFFTHHRPRLAHRDMEFFVKAKEQGWAVERVGRWRRSVSLAECLSY